MAALKYWVWLTALPGLSNRSRLLLLERYGSPEDVYYADAEELALTEGLTPGQAQLLSDKPLFVIINSYTTGLAPSAVSYASDVVFGKDHGGKTAAGELGLPVRQSGLVLPCGSTGRWEP